MDPVRVVHGMTVWVPESRVAELAAEEQVLWIEEGGKPLTETNDGVRALMNADPVKTAPYNLDGTGVRLFVFDGGQVRATHNFYNPGSGSRVTITTADTISDHSTHVAGTAAGDGDGGRGEGFADAASILSTGYDQVGGTMLFWDNTGDIESEYGLARNTHNADLANNSIGSNTAANGFPCVTEGDYGMSAALLDEIVRGDNGVVNDPVPALGQRQRAHGWLAPRPLRLELPDHRRALLRQEPDPRRRSVLGRRRDDHLQLLGPVRRRPHEAHRVGGGLRDRTGEWRDGRVLLDRHQRLGDQRHLLRHLDGDPWRRRPRGPDDAGRARAGLRRPQRPAAPRDGQGDADPHRRRLRKRWPRLPLRLRQRRRQGADRPAA
jgi:hypothetical protein